MDTRSTAEYLDEIQSRVERKLGQLHTRLRRAADEEQRQALLVQISHCEKALDEIAMIRPLVYRTGV